MNHKEEKKLTVIDDKRGKFCKLLNGWMRFNIFQSQFFDIRKNVDIEPILLYASGDIEVTETSFQRFQRHKNLWFELNIFQQKIVEGFNILVDVKENVFRNAFYTRSNPEMLKFCESFQPGAVPPFGLIDTVT